jgi:hypothetical protein
MKFSRKNNHKHGRTYKHKKGGLRPATIPETPKKTMPYVSRLSEEEDRMMRDYEDYDVEPVDLESLEMPPIGDDIPEGYDKLSKKKGQLGGKRKMSMRNKRTKRKKASKKSKRVTKHKSSRKMRRISKRTGRTTKK